VQIFLQWREHSAVLRLSANEADRNIQCNSVHPGWERTGCVVLWPGSPKLGRDLLRKVIAVFRAPAIRVDCLEDDSAMQLEKRFKIGLIPIRHDVTFPSLEDALPPRVSDP